ncbi:hypothetical protein KUTeg_021443 [Tegillarca granosa]|uniref:Uncharacterized protein n=1 Tax=Tegillarca granosa TaxID=220873 RepID=A0ABQ9E6I0_TEGGR|nr:hypothetical protein KUTeg_021443 [Tegillarca granosa]
MDLKGVFHKTEMIRFVVGAALLVVVYCQIQPQAQPVIGTPRALLQTIAVRGRTNAACQTTCTGGGICVKEKNCNDQQYAIDPNTLPCLTRGQVEGFMKTLVASQQRGGSPSAQTTPGNDNRGSGLFSSNRPFTNAYSTGHLCVYYVTCASRKVLFVYTCTEAKRKVVKILTFGTNL